MSGNILEIGPLAIQEAIQEILRTHLGTQVAAWETAKGLDAGTIKVPDTTTGYSLSRRVFQEEAPSIRIYLDESGLIEDRTQFPGAGSTDARTTARVKIRTRDNVASKSEVQCAALSECARFILNKYWRAYFTEIRAMNFNVRVDFQGASLREQFQSTGMTYRGRQDQNTDEEIDLVCAIIHRAAYAVSYDKDLPTP